MRLALTILLLLALLPVLVYIAAAATVGRDRVWETAFGPFPATPIDFADPETRTRPNRWLVCPDGWCAEQADATSPIFDAPIQHLRAAWALTMAAEPHTTPILPGAADGDDQLDYRVLTPLLRFPDTLTVRFIALDGATSTLAILSRSHLGYSDLGANQARVERILGAVADRLAAGS